jgi:hypothetical protein
MLSISAICAARSAPMAKPELSLKADVAAGAVGGGAAVPAGEGVAGTPPANRLGCEGAAGGAGVDAATGAGVDGAFEEEGDGAGAAFGCKVVRSVQVLDTGLNIPLRSCTQ